MPADAADRAVIARCSSVPLGRLMAVGVACGALVAGGATPASGQGNESPEARRVQLPSEVVHYPLGEREGIRERQRPQKREPTPAGLTPVEASVAATSHRTDEDGSVPATLAFLVAAVILAQVALVSLLRRRRARRARRLAAGAPTSSRVAARKPAASEGRQRSGAQVTDAAPEVLARSNSCAVANQKGGVGKTTITLVLGAALARRGQRALVVDLDPQASATKALRVSDSGRPTVADVMLRPATCSLADAVVNTTWGVDLAASGRALGSTDALTAAQGGVLSDQLDTVGDYDLVLIDCPPSLGSLTVGALSAAARVLVVTEPSPLALHGTQELLDFQDYIRRDRNRRLELAGIILNRVEATAQHKQTAAELEAAFGDRILQPHVPRRALMQDAMRRGVPPQELPTPWAAEMAELFDALATRIEQAMPASRAAPAPRRD